MAASITNAQYPSSSRIPNGTGSDGGSMEPATAQITVGAGRRIQIAGAQIDVRWSGLVVEQTNSPSDAYYSDPITSDGNYTYSLVADGVYFLTLRNGDGAGGSGFFSLPLQVETGSGTGSYEDMTPDNASIIFDGGVSNADTPWSVLVGGGPPPEVCFWQDLVGSVVQTCD